MNLVYIRKNRKLVILHLFLEVSLKYWVHSTVEYSSENKIVRDVSELLDLGHSGSIIYKI